MVSSHVTAFEMFSLQDERISGSQRLEVIPLSI